jgi:hypothetical protein
MSKVEQSKKSKASEAKEVQTPENEEVQIDPRSFSYRPDGTVEMSSQVFEVLRGYFAEQAERFPPKKIFLHQKPVPGKGKDEKGKTVTTVEWADFENDEEYRKQKPLEYRDVDSFNIVYMNNILHDTHVKNIEKGNAVPVDVLKEEFEKENANRLTKVED